MWFGSIINCAYMTDSLINCFLFAIATTAQAFKILSCIAGEISRSGRGTMFLEVKTYLWTFTYGKVADHGDCMFDCLFWIFSRILIKNWFWSPIITHSVYIAVFLYFNSQIPDIDRYLAWIAANLITNLNKILEVTFICCCTPL